MKDFLDTISDYWQLVFVGFSAVSVLVITYIKSKFVTVNDYKTLEKSIEEFMDSHGDNFQSLDRRVERLETDATHLATKKDIVELEGQIATLAEIAKATAKQTGFIHKYLMEQKK